MTDIDLLPLPEHTEAGEFTFDAHVFEHMDMVSYARANMEPLITEIETLRNEVSWMRAARLAYASEFPATEDGDPDTGNIHANIRALKTEIEEMRSEVAEWKRVASAQAELHGEAEARAERLAEALRELVEYVQETAHHNAPAAAAARAALRDHDQEDRND